MDFVALLFVISERTFSMRIFINELDKRLIIILQTLST